MRIRTWKHCLLALCFSFTLVGCGYQFRNPKELPPAFHHVYIDSNQPYSGLTTLIRQIFKAMKVGTVDKANAARYTLQITNSHYEHDNPNITTSNQAITLAFRLITTFQIKNARGDVVFGPKTLTAVRYVILNANQLFTNNISPLVKQQLSRRMSNLIFDQLISQRAHKALSKQ